MMNFTKANAPKTSVLMTIGDCAVDLGISETEVMRLIGKGLLKAAFVGSGDSGCWRVTAAALEAYVASGCPDARCPDYQAVSDASWYDGREIASLAGMFYSEALAALEQQMPDKLRVQQDYNAGSPLQYVASTTGALAALIQKPIPASFVGGRGTGTAKSRFQYYWQPYAVGLIRDAAMSILNSMAGCLSSDPLNDLFSGGPEEFSTISNAAYAQAAKRFISTSETNMLLVPGMNGGKQPVGVNLRWPLAEILTPGNRASMIQLTF